MKIGELIDILEGYADAQGYGLDVYGVVTTDRGDLVRAGRRLYEAGCLVLRDGRRMPYSEYVEKVWTTKPVAEADPV